MIIVCQGHKNLVVVQTCNIYQMNKGKQGVISNALKNLIAQSLAIITDGATYRNLVVLIKVIIPTILTK